MLTHVHKVEHLVVGIFDQGWQSWWSRGVHCSWPDVGLRSRSCWPDSEGVANRTHGRCVKSLVTHADASNRARLRRNWRGVRPFMFDQTRPIDKNHLWTLTGSDQTHGGTESGRAVARQVVVLGAWASKRAVAVAVRLVSARCVQSLMNTHGVTPIFWKHKIWMQTICVEHIEQIVKEKYHTQCLITIANHSSLDK
jgi:hypothetical protein